MPSAPEFINIRTFSSAWLEHPRIIKADALNPALQAKKIIELAEDSAKASELASQQAYEEQKQKGYQDGKREAYQQILQEMVQEAASLDERLKNLDQQINNLVSSALRQLTGELPDSIKVGAVIRAGLQKMRKANSLRIVTNSNDPALGKAILDLVGELAPNMEFVDISQDSSLPEGQVVFETPLGRIATSLEDELKLIESVTLKKSVTNVTDNDDN